MTTAKTVRSKILSYAAAQDIGGRKNQEDRYAVREFSTSDGQPAVLALVADGIGGHDQGEIASQMASERVPFHLLEKKPAASEVGLALRSAVEQAGRDINNAAQVDVRDDPMGTTCTAIVVVDGRLYLSHVGDTRLYLLRGADLHQLSIDHTWAEEAIRAGFPAAEIRAHPNRGILRRHLGIDPAMEIDTRFRLNRTEDSIQDGLTHPMQLAPGDVLMLCSDGTADVLEPADISRILSSDDPGQAADGLVKQALDSGANDNVTAVVLRFGADKSPLRSSQTLLIAASILLVGIILVIVAMALRLFG